MQYQIQQNHGLLSFCFLFSQQTPIFLDIQVPYFFLFVCYVPLICSLQYDGEQKRKWHAGLDVMLWMNQVKVQVIPNLGTQKSLKETISKQSPVFKFANSKRITNFQQKKTIAVEITNNVLYCAKYIKNIQVSLIFLLVNGRR